jgi:hypothetical protein
MNFTRARPSLGLDTSTVRDILLEIQRGGVSDYLYREEGYSVERDVSR